MWNKNKYKLFSLVFSTLLFFYNNCYTQKSILDQKISIDVSKEKVETVLTRIEKMASVRFSYNSLIINSDSIVSFKTLNKTVKEVLSLCLGKNYYFKSTERHIIILQKSNTHSSNPEKNEYYFSGIVLNSRTNEPIPLATVYDIGSMQSVLSDSNGKFNLKLIPKTNYLAIRCSKSAFKDTVNIVNIKSNEQNVFRLNKIESSIEKLNTLHTRPILQVDSASTTILRTFITNEMLINSKNVIMYDKRIAQLSLLPKLGTNLRMSGTVINHFSVNILGGYSKGVAGFEAGGIININRSDVKGIQICCMINYSGKDVTGFQASGILNRTFGNVNGLQLSVLGNIGADTVNGVQMAGIINSCRKTMHGIQISPCINISQGHETGSQIAGLLNYAPNPRFQFGLINIADTSNGMTIGLINLVKHGYYTISVTTDEIQTGSLLFSMGTHKLYSIVGLSRYSAGNHVCWGADYGIGSHFMHTRRISVITEFRSTVISTYGNIDSTVISRINLSTRLSLRLGKKLYISVGPTLNTFISGTSQKVDEYIQQALSEKTKHYTSVNTRYDAWVGGYAGLSYKF